MKRLLLCFVGLFLLVGCGPKLTPTLAERELMADATMHQAASAKVGESLLGGLDSFGYALYSPRENGALLTPDGVSLGDISPDQEWIAYYQLDDGSLVIEAPTFISPDDIRLGLRIDKDGRVVGRRPWFDLKAKARFNQPSWDGERRLLFARNGTYSVDVFVFDITYVGMADGVGVFAYQDFKAIGIKALGSSQIRIEPEQSVQLHGLNIKIFAIYPDHVRYVVEPVR